MIFYIILAFISLFVAIVIDVVTKDKDKNYHGVVFFLGTFCAIMMVRGASSNIPTAMDVYQGKTTLEITYKDSVAVDSTVVFKRDVK